KQPNAMRDFNNVDAQIGTGENYRATVDANHRFNDTTAVRLNLMWTDAGVTGRDEVHSNRLGVAASLGFGLGTNMSFVLNYKHQLHHRIPDDGIVIGAPTGTIKALPASEYGVDPKTFEQFTNDRDRPRADILTANYRYEIGPNFTFTSDTRFGSYGR